MTQEERAALQEVMRERYAVHYSKLTTESAPFAADSKENIPDNNPNEVSPVDSVGMSKSTNVATEPDITDTTAKPQW